MSRACAFWLLLFVWAPGSSCLRLSAFTKRVERNRQIHRSNNLQGRGQFSSLPVISSRRCFLRDRGYLSLEASKSDAVRTADSQLDDLPTSAFPERRDNLLEEVLIFILSFFLARVPSRNRERAMRMVYPGMPFEGFISISKTLMDGRSAAEIRGAIVALLNSLFPKTLREKFRSKYKEDPQWICEKSSQWMSFGLLTWLVGPVERRDIEFADLSVSSSCYAQGNNIKAAESENIPSRKMDRNEIMEHRERYESEDYSRGSSKIAKTTSANTTTAFKISVGIESEAAAGDDGVDRSSGAIAVDKADTRQSGSDAAREEKKAWKSGVKLTECRYLMESGCKAACLTLCKGPTQEFFGKELGIPLYMKPDFSDCSCEMLFGVAPPPEEDDPAYRESCFATCPVAPQSKLYEPWQKQGQNSAKSEIRTR